MATSAAPARRPSRARSPRLARRCRPRCRCCSRRQASAALLPTVPDARARRLRRRRHLPAAPRPCRSRPCRCSTAAPRPMRPVRVPSEGAVLHRPTCLRSTSTRPPRRARSIARIATIIPQRRRSAMLSTATRGVMPVPGPLRGTWRDGSEPRGAACGPDGGTPYDPGGDPIVRGAEGCALCCALDPRGGCCSCGAGVCCAAGRALGRCWIVAG